MIVGIGIDIIDVRRIHNIIKKYGEKFKGEWKDGEFEGQQNLNDEIVDFFKL